MWKSHHVDHFPTGKPVAFQSLLVYQVFLRERHAVRVGGRPAGEIIYEGA
jgi:hypothetical protein